MLAPMLAATLGALAILAAFIGLWRLLTIRDPLEARLTELGLSHETSGLAVEREDDTARRRSWSTLSRLLAGFGLGPRLARGLMRADISLTAAEFTVIMLAAGAVGFAIGTLRAGPLLGLAVGALLACLPLVYLKRKESKRLKAFTDQLPDVLTLLVGGLRAGYGLVQSIRTIVEQAPPPSGPEFARVMRSIEFGVPVQQALRDMADRIGSDDLELVVTAVCVQYELGGNLAQTLETIGDTVRDRIRIFREIRVLTAQQRFTGYVLAIWPLVLGVAIFLINPVYMSKLFAPGWIRLLPVLAIVMQILGFLLIRRIVDIEV